MLLIFNNLTFYFHTRTYFLIAFYYHFVAGGKAFGHQYAAAAVAGNGNIAFSGFSKAVYPDEFAVVVVQQDGACRHHAFAHHGAVRQIHFAYHARQQGFVGIVDGNFYIITMGDDIGGNTFVEHLACECFAIQGGDADSRRLAYFDGGNLFLRHGEFNVYLADIQYDYCRLQRGDIGTHAGIDCSYIAVLRSL